MADETDAETGPDTRSNVAGRGFRGAIEDWIDSRRHLAPFVAIAIVLFVIGMLPSVRLGAGFVSNLGTNQLLGVIVGLLASQTIYQARTGDRVAVDEDGGRIPRDSTRTETRTSGAGAVGGAIVGLAAGSGGTVALLGAVVGLVVGDTIEDRWAVGSAIEGR